MPGRKGRSGGDRKSKAAKKRGARRARGVRIFNRPSKTPPLLHGTTKSVTSYLQWLSAEFAAGNLDHDASREYRGIAKDHLATIRLDHTMSELQEAERILAEMRELERLAQEREERIRRHMLPAGEVQ